MKIEFRFNGQNQAILIPENAKDKQLLQLCFGECTTLIVKPSPSANTDCIILEAERFRSEDVAYRGGEIKTLVGEK